MKDNRLGFNTHIVPLKAPVDSAGTAYATPYVNLKDALSCTFLAYFGVVTATSADQSVIVTVEASTSTTSNATEVQVPFKYRASGATGTDTWGAVTSATAAGGLTVLTTDDGKAYLIEVDPAVIEATHGQRDAKFVRLVVGIDAGGTVTLNSVVALLDPAYPQTTHLSAS
jgi:pyruvate-formate lyase